MDILRRAFRDIVAGSTRTKILSRDCFIRHLNYSDQTELDAQRDEFFNAARKEGLPTDSEKEDQLRKNDLWNDDKERSLLAARDLVPDLIEAKRQNMKLPSLVQRYIEDIAKAEKDLKEKEAEKRQLLGLTCEAYADQQINDLYVVLNLFRDSAFSNPLFTLEEFDHVTEEEVNQIISQYSAAMECCSPRNIKRLAMSPEFQRYFGLAGDNLTQCFKRPLLEWTFYQVDLVRWGAHFRRIYSEHDVSQWDRKILEDPDLLMDHAAAVTKGKEELRAKGAEDPNTIVQGMNGQDARALGVGQQQSMAAEIQSKHGGSVVNYFMNKARKGG